MDEKTLNDALQDVKELAKMVENLSLSASTPELFNFKQYASAKLVVLESKLSQS